MEVFVNACVVAATIFAFLYLGYVLIRPESF